VVRHLPLVRKVWGLNPEPIKSPTRCQRLATAVTLMCGLWALAQSRGDGHHLLMTPETVSSEYNADLILIIHVCKNRNTQQHETK